MFWMGVSRCCCGACWEASDDFEWGPTTTLTADWDECEGDWEVVEYPPSSGNMVLRGNEAGYVTWLKSPDQTLPRTGRMQITIWAPTAGAHYRIIAFYDDDCGQGTWIAADLVMTTSSQGTLDLVDGSGSVESSGAVSGNVGSQFTLTLCVGLDHVWAMVSSFINPVRLCHNQEYNDQLYFALSNESDTQIVMYDDAYQIDHHDNNPVCPSCDCSCDGYCSPLEQCLTIHNDPEWGGCENIDGTSLTLRTVASPCKWETSNWTCSQVSGHFELIRSPGGDYGSVPVSSYVLKFVVGGTTVKSWTPNENSTCHPWYLEYNVDSWNDTCSAACCTGDVVGPNDLCPDGSTPQDCNPHPVDKYNFCKGHFFITIVEGACT